MPNLQQNQSVKDTLRAGKVLNVTVTTGSVGVSIPSAEINKTITTTESFGYFDNDVTFELSAFSGSIADYSVSDPFKQLQNIGFDESGDLVDQEGKKIFSKPINARLAVTTIGDSLLANGQANASTTGGSIPGQTSQSHVTWALSQLEIPYIITPRAVGGKTINMVITEQLPSALTDNTDILWIHAGVNDLNPSIDASTPTVSEIVARMDYLLRLAQNVPLVILDSITALTTGSVLTSGAYPRRADIPLINAGFAESAEKYKNVIYNDIYSVTAADDLGNAKPGVNVGVDGTHWATYGAFLTGMQSYLNIIKSGVSLRRFRRPTTVYSLPRINGTGGSKSPSTGTINGDVATGYTVSIATNATGVVVTGSVDGSKGKQRLRIQNGNDAATVVRMQLTSSTDYLTGLANGDVVRATGRVDMISNDGSLYRHDLSIFPDGATLYGALQKSAQEDGSSNKSFPVFPREPYTVKLSAETALTSTPSSINILYSIEVAPGGDVTLDLWAMGFEEVTAY